MFPPNVRLGPLTRTIANNAIWLNEDEFPSSQECADEVERVLNFAGSRGQFDRLLPSLIGTARSRDAALAEVRPAYYFDRNQFRVTDWEPLGELEKKGEFRLQSPSGSKIFVEVKNPSWKGELRDEEVAQGRREGPKYINGEAREVRSWKNIQIMIDRAYPKFSINQPNLLVIADNFFVSLQFGAEWHAKQALYQDQTEGRFITNAFERIGGVGFFWVEDDYTYNMRLFLNPFSLKTTELPEDLKSAFHAQILKVPRPVSVPSTSRIILTDFI